MKLTFNKSYFILFLILFIVEALIATYLKSGFIRHTFGDYIVVMVVYSFMMSFIKLKPVHAAIITLLIAFTIEFLQLTSLLSWLGLENSRTAKLVLGSTFEITDLVAYSLGVITILLLEMFNKKTES